jgi:hypothetical protein
VSAARGIRVDSGEALERATSARTLLRVFLPRIEIVSPSLSGEASRELQERVDKLVDACGCGEGSAGVLVSLGAYGTYAATIGASHGVLGFAWRALVVMFVGASVGKLYGLARARIELRGVLMELRSRVEEMAITAEDAEDAEKSRGADKLSGVTRNVRFGDLGLAERAALGIDD